MSFCFCPNLDPTLLCVTMSFPQLHWPETDRVFSEPGVRPFGCLSRCRVRSFSLFFVAGKKRRSTNLLHLLHLLLRARLARNAMALMCILRARYAFPARSVVRWRRHPRLVAQTGLVLAFQDRDCSYSLAILSPYDFRSSFLTNSIRQDSRS